MKKIWRNFVILFPISGNTIWKQNHQNANWDPPKITYLGYDICKTKGISPGEAKTEVLRNWPCPTNLKKIRGFLGLTSFFRWAIKDYSVLSADLNKLVRKSSGYHSGPLPVEAQKSFEALKTAMVSKPCSAPVNFDKRFYVTCDASATQKFTAKGRARVAVWVMGDAEHDGGVPIHRAVPGVKILHIEK